MVLLGTGTPVPDPDRSGSAIAIVVDESAYLVDFGPGVIRRAKAAVFDRHITALEPANLKVAFVTHLHSDHTAGYSDLILTGWTAGRRTPLEVYGPAGLQSMTEHLLQAYRIDIEARTNPEGDQRSNPEGWKVNRHEIKSGVIYKDPRAPPPSRRNTPWRVTDTALTPRTAASSFQVTPVLLRTRSKPNGCDVLIHEVRALEMFTKRPEDRRSFGAKNHTTSEQLAALATKAKPGLLIVYHAWLSWRPSNTPSINQPVSLTTGELHSTPDVLQKEIGSGYSRKLQNGSPHWTRFELLPSN